MTDQSKWENDEKSKVELADAATDTPKEAVLPENRSTTVAEEHSAGDAKEYVYHWNYDEQDQHDRKAEAKARKRGLRAYAISVTAIFLACLLLLTGVVVWSANRPTGWSGVIESVNDGIVMIMVEHYDGTTSYGTGFFITADGYIATNYHVVETARSIRVQLYSGDSGSAIYVDGSKYDDLAVLKVDGSGFTVPLIGDSDGVVVGEHVLAIGHPAGAECSWSASTGIISSTNRVVSNSAEQYVSDSVMFQTDAALNPGNSGGPLFNENGEVIAIVTSRLAEYENTDFEGIGFAIPINEAMNSLQTLMDETYDQDKSTVSRLRPVLGLSLSDIREGTHVRITGDIYTMDRDAVYVTDVQKGYTAFKPGDIIYAMDGHEVTDVDTLRDLLYSYKAGEQVVFSIFRSTDGMSELRISIILGVPV